MRNIVRTIVRGGPPAVLGSTALAWLLRDEVHYFLRTSVLENVAMIVGAAGVTVWVSAMGKDKGKEKEKAPTQSENVPTESRMVVDAPTPHSLPHSQSNTHAQWNQQGASFRRIR